MIQIWKKKNPGWKLVLHDDTDCIDLVERFYPEWLQLYKYLPKSIERADVFRYLVLHHYGGVYADTDVECVKPLDEWITSDVKLIVGYEHEFTSVEEASSRSYARRLQLQQWFIAAAPKHTLMYNVISRISKHLELELMDGLNRNDRGTLERTGPGIWTDAVIGYLREQTEKYARELENTSSRRVSSRSFAEETWVLPRVSTASFPNGADLVDPRSQLVLVLHHFIGSWKEVKHETKHTTSLPSEVLAKDIKMSTYGHPVTILQHDAYPAINDRKPVMLYVPEAKIRGGYDGTEQSSSITTWGYWQGSASPGSKLARFHNVRNQFEALNGLFIELGASVGLNSVLQACSGTKSLSIAQTASQAEAIYLSALASGCIELLEVKTQPNTTRASSATDSYDTPVKSRIRENSFESEMQAVTRFVASTGHEALSKLPDKSIDFHIESSRGARFLSRLLIQELNGWQTETDTFAHPIRLVTIALDDRFRAVNHLMELLLILHLSWQEEFLIFTAGTYCRDGFERDTQFLSWLFRRVTRIFTFFSFSDTGPTREVSKHSVFEEGWCQFDPTVEQELRVEDAYVILRKEDKEFAPSSKTVRSL